MSYVRKMGAYGLAVAAAFAVALAVLMASASPVAADHPDASGGTDTDDSAAPGDSVDVTFAGSALSTIESNDDDADTNGVRDTQYRFRIHPDSTASGSFAANDGTSLRCADDISAAGNTCDLDEDTTERSIKLRINVDEDSSLGEIFVQIYKRAGDGGDDASIVEHAIEVKRANPVVAISASGKPSPDAIDKEGTTASAVKVKVVNARGSGISGQSLTVTTTTGVLLSAGTVCGGAGAPDTNGACTATTDDDGIATVYLKGNGVTGTATVTFLHVRAGLSRQAEVIVFGAPASMTAEAEQSSIQVGGGTFIVVTILDSAGNPVVGALADADRDADNGGVSGPETASGTALIKVMADQNVDKDADGDQKADKVDYPACGNQVAVPDDETTPAIDESEQGLLKAGIDVVEGTNVDGKCVIRVSAPDATSPAEDATRGTHTVTIAVYKAAGDVNTKVGKMDVVINVGGAPSSIEDDASDRVDPLSTNKITVTVLDDEIIRVGETRISILKIEGDGELTSGEGVSVTKDGNKSFTYVAPLSEGTVVFLVRAGTNAAGGYVVTDHTIELTIGAAMEEPVTPVVPDVETPVDPETPVMADATLTGSGSIRFFSGGSVDDLSAAATAACPGGAIVWVQADDGTWPAPLSTTAPAFANAPFTAAFPDGFDGPTGVWVSSCDEGSMDNEGDMDEGDAG